MGIINDSVGQVSLGQHPTTRLNALISEINHVSSIMDGLQLDYIFAALLPKFVVITVSTQEGNQNQQKVQVQKYDPTRYQNAQDNTSSKKTKTIFVEMTDEETMKDALSSLSALYSYREGLYGDKYQLTESIEQAEKKEYKAFIDKLYLESIAQSET